MEAKAKTADAASPNQPLPAEAQPARPWHGAVFALISAAAAELLLGAFSQPRTAGPGFEVAFGRFFILFFALNILHCFCLYSFRLYKPNLKNLTVLTLVIVVSVVLVWLGCIVSQGLSQYLTSLKGFGPVRPEAFYFGIPFATGGLLLQSILGLHYGMVFTIALSLIMGISFGDYMVFPSYVLATNLVACLSLSQFRSRSAFIKAGFNVALVSFPLAVGYVVMQGQLGWNAALVTLICALLGGILSAFLASGAAPVVEHVGGYVTDMRLLEMATLDHPLLKELSIQAPGTWNHCMVMGMMVEAAAQGVGANPVLARVGAYFHDIGKIKKPIYFVENQGGEDNRHDKLSTSMSALIIRTHVKDGIDLARKHKLPKAIEDMIPQHHGTSRIEFFFDKARKEAEDAGGDPDSVDESLYRYPGPKPQTREAGILMLADGIEAAARTLSDPTYDRIQGMVQKMINKVFASGELDECDLTLKDLHSIAKNFTRVLSGIYHQRIAYSEPAEKTKADPEKMENAEMPEQSKESKDRDTPKEGLKRLGL